ncbi:glycosyltransferase family 2 protein [Desulfurivibrio alkaliphilus]|uniref:Glycosyl transferase family 2 n=1 Tax=Desulfurivibrio alkaliphilus (strain DSM 19089 / UNIQEM U267 / AHT2) TaxID=589865 RepID=D6Z015_DESAT|nr:glycosyltransferase family A protein [Desulfurivibrio alkaliphilus]ADH85172.1 glycosyl transferase family 2 [Desulfurivibrio alkaliphilus AHT 2]
MNDEFPPVSVIIPTYNRADFLDGAMASVLAQNYPCFELLVVDDGSRDQTAEVVAAWQRRLAAKTDEPADSSVDSRPGEAMTRLLPAPGSRPSLRYLRQENRGPAAARNLGIKEARHDLLAFLDSDDRWRPGKLAAQAGAMAARPEFLLSHTEEIWWRNGRRLNQKKRHRKQGGELFARSLELCVIGMSTVMARRRLFEAVGMFDENLPCCEDYDLWLRLTARHPVLYLEQPLTEKHGGRPDQVSVQYRVGMDRFRIQAIGKLLQDGALTREQTALAQQELQRKCLIYGEGCLKHGRQQEASHYLKLAKR